MIFINVAIFQNLLNSRKRKNDYKFFLFFMIKIIEILKSLETTQNDITKKLNIHIVIEITFVTLKQKIIKFFHKFKNVLNFKKSRICCFIEFIIIKSNSLSTFLRFLKTKYIFCRLKNLRRCKNISKNFLKRNLSISIIFFSFRLFFSL